MQSFLKWLLILFAGLLGIALVAILVTFVSTGAKLSRVYEIQPALAQIPDEPPEELDSFQQLMVSFCQDCHGLALAGQVMEDDPLIGVIAAPNLTSGDGGIGGRFSDEDWVRAIRHGVDDDGTPLLIMPSDFLHSLDEEDLGVVIAYVKNLPPVNNEMPEPTLGLMGRFFLLMDPAILPAEGIDHNAPIPSRIEPDVTVERGGYLATVCTICHGLDLSGGPNTSSGLNLTPSGNLGSWSEADFINTIRTGTTPEGITFDPVEMPWKQISVLSDAELKAIWRYLQSLPPMEKYFFASMSCPQVKK